MSDQFPPENWPYGASFNPEYGESQNQRASGQPTPQQAGSASFPFPGQFATPSGAPATTQAPQALPYPYPSYTIPAGTAVPSQAAPAATAPAFVEQSYIENILRLNLGKTATVYATFEGNTEWNAKKFTGTIEAAGRDHVIVVDKQTNVRYLIPMVFVNYFTFNEPLEYSYPYAPPSAGR
ncbi:MULTISPECIES: spore coat protein GerQ [unclassified Sporolactobacillus]|uniref:spore coat protein GerQ n=1 Tax=unclassified Sporolactobacillus TaxID=2628533 RepID=UPI00236851D9|nr:spore coat protein GerQ [Sporolactobacillus sp. CQH2019]MDD9148339.1 spore coat protein GerQ [Sporolactobacillus sp. CQH2019]